MATLDLINIFFVDCLLLVLLLMTSVKQAVHCIHDTIPFYISRSTNHRKRE